MRSALVALVLLAACGAGDDASPDAESPWSAGPALPGGRLEPGVIAVGDAVYVIGGFDDGLQVVTDVWVHGDAGWQPGPAAPAPLTHMNLAVVDDRLLLLGGLRGREFAPVGDSWILDGGGWRPLAAMPDGEARGAAAVIVDGHRVTLAGGAGATSSLASVWSYDLDGDRWSRGPDLPSPRSHAMGVRAPDGAALVIGGTATLDASQPLGDVLARRGEGGWQPRAAMPTPRGGCAAAVVGARWVCAGGEAHFEAVDATEAYDLAADAWTALAPMPRPRAGTGGALHGGALWVPGGAHRLAYDPIREVEILALP